MFPGGNGFNRCSRSPYQAGISFLFTGTKTFELYFVNHSAAHRRQTILLIKLRGQHQLRIRKGFARQSAGHRKRPGFLFRFQRGHGDGFSGQVDRQLPKRFYPVSIGFRCRGGKRDGDRHESIGLAMRMRCGLTPVKYVITGKEQPAFY